MLPQVHDMMIDMRNRNRRAAFDVKTSSEPSGQLEPRACQGHKGRAEGVHLDDNRLQGQGGEEAIFKLQVRTIYGRS